MGSAVGGVANVSSEGWFGSSLKPRRVRPQTLEFRVGDVVRYRDFKLTCVVIGWDKQLRAPEEWVQLVYGKEAEYFVEQPHYTLVCEICDLNYLYIHVHIVYSVPYGHLRGHYSHWRSNLTSDL